MLLACLYPPVKALLFNHKLMNPEYFPFTEVMNLILFNRHMNNYDVQCIYNSHEDSDKYVGEQIPDTLKLIEDNKDDFAFILSSGSLIVEFSYYYHN